MRRNSISLAHGIRDVVRLLQHPIDLALIDYLRRTVTGLTICGCSGKLSRDCRNDNDRTQ